MRYKIRLLAPALLMIVSCRLGAASEAAPEPLPDSVLFCLSVKSPMQALNSIDAFAVAVTADTPYAVWPGMLLFRAMMSSPIPASAWDPGREAHIIISDNDSGGLGAMSVMLSIPGFDQFRAEMEKAGESMERHESGLWRGKLAGMGRVWLADLGAGRVLIGDDRDALAAMAETLRQWSPKPGPDGDISFAFGRGSVAPSGELHTLLQGILDNINGGRKNALRFAKEAGLNPSRVEGVLNLAGIGVAWLIAELGKLDGGRIDLAMDGQVLYGSLTVAAESDALCAKIAAALKGKPNPDYELARAIGGDAAVFFQYAPDEQILPDGREIAGKIAAVVGDALYPEGRERLERLSQRIFDAGVKERIGGRLVRGGKVYDVQYSRLDDPQKVIDSLRDAWALAIEWLDGFFAGGGLGVRVAVEEVDKGDLRYSRVYITIEDGSPASRMLGQLDSAGVPSAFRDLLDRQKILVAKSGDVLVQVWGEVDEDILREAIAAAGGVDDPILASPEARKVVDRIRYRQAGLVVVNFRGLCDLLLAQSRMDAGFRRLFDDVFGDVIDDLEMENEMACLGAGSADGYYAVGGAVSSKGINALIKVGGRVTSLTGEAEFDDEEGYEPEDDGYEPEEDEEKSAE